MKKYIIFSLLLLVGCSNSTKLVSNKTVKEVFNGTEIKDISTILNFFDQQVCKANITDKDSIYNCYQHFFGEMHKCIEKGELKIPISFSKQQKLYAQISDSTFNRIWDFHKSWSNNSTDTLKSISYRYNSKYINFLEKLGKEHEFVKSYHESYIAAGDINPSCVGGFISYYKRLKIKDERVRLFVAIHYLTLNDRYNRKEKY